VPTADGALCPSTVDAATDRFAMTGAKTLTVGTVRTVAMTFPETTEAPHFEATSFRVRGKIFATIPGNQLGRRFDSSVGSLQIGMFRATESSSCASNNVWMRQHWEGQETPLSTYPSCERTVPQPLAIPSRWYTTETGKLSTASHSCCSAIGTRQRRQHKRPSPDGMCAEIP
jgi:hypothetical protein